jgi:hypothetical protein
MMSIVAPIDRDDLIRQFEFQRSNALALLLPAADG